MSSELEILKTKYDALKLENERLKADLEFSHMTYETVFQERDRALEMLKKMAGASDALLQNYADEKAKVEDMRARFVSLDLARFIELYDALAEYRKEFGENK